LIPTGKFKREKNRSQGKLAYKSSQLDGTKGKKTEALSRSFEKIAGFRKTVALRTLDSQGKNEGLKGETGSLRQQRKGGVLSDGFQRNGG